MVQLSASAEPLGENDCEPDSIEFVTAEPSNKFSPEHGESATIELIICEGYFNDGLAVDGKEVKSANIAEGAVALDGREAEEER